MKSYSLTIFCCIKNSVVIDFACGTGGFLTSTIDYLKKQDSQEMLEKIQQNIMGTELKPLPYILSVTNMLLHDLDGTNIKRGNSFSRKLEDYTENDKVDVIVMNPPFGATIMDGLENNFPLKYRTSESSDLFIALILYRLKKDGKVGVIIPDSFLAGTESSRVNIKRKLLNDCNLHTIVRLPNTCFAPYATVATNILFFDRTKSTKEIWYYEHQYPSGKKSYSKTNPIKKKDFKPILAWWDKRKENDFSWKIDISTVEKNNYNLDFKNPNKRIEIDTKTPKEYIDNIIEDYKEVRVALNKLKEVIDNEN
ncbi:MAG: N-6 DNA methylase [Candidatus Izemoplasmatales bacterium]|nr:N-6 DNA methylase [Candidatus Izemoplasmatales bacterium]